MCAVVLIEGFDHYAIGLITLKGWSSNGNQSMQTGRFGGQCDRLNNVGGAVNITKTLPASYGTLFAGVAMRGPTTVNALVFQLRAGATATVALAINTTTKVIEVRNSSGTLIASGTTPLVAGTWYYIEVKAFINGAAGTVEVHLNGVVEIASTVGNFGVTNLDNIVIGSSLSNTNADFDDIYVVDTSGAAPRNTWLGDVRVATLLPNADGAHTAWTPNSGTAHFSRVNETLADGDTSYVSDATPGDIDTYAIAPVDTAATVFSIQRTLYARKDDAALRQIAPVIRQAGADTVGTTVTLSSSYLFYSDIMLQDPTSADWTPATLNADEFGVKEIA